MEFERHGEGHELWIGVAENDDVLGVAPRSPV